jgi:hypothetical protein
MLGTIQMLACGGMCVLERVWLGEGFTPAILELEVGISLAVQAAVALIAAIALTLLAKLVRFISGILRGGIRAPRALPIVGARPAIQPRVLLLSGGTGVRGPPVS